MDPTDGAPMAQPPSNRREYRAKRARETVVRSIPDTLMSSPRARHGLDKAELFVDPPAAANMSQSGTEVFPRNDLKIRVRSQDPLSAASEASRKLRLQRRRRPSEPRKNVAVLNMASSEQPGGSFFNGGNSQEEFLCARTTLFPSLSSSFYPLPEVSGIHSADVLVYRNSWPEADELPKHERCFIDVISAGMFHFSDAKAGGCSCGVSYCDGHRDLVIRKMKAVLRIAEGKGAETIVLGAWGCGAPGNPVKEIAKAWRKVIVGAPRQRKPNAERWTGIKEITFAVPDSGMAREFDNAFRDVLIDDTPCTTPPPKDQSDSANENPDDRVSDLLTKIAETELQLESPTTSRLRANSRAKLATLNRELAEALTASKQPVEAPTDADSFEDDFVVTGFPASDGEDGTFYALSPSDAESDDDVFSLGTSDIYEFRPSTRDKALPRDAKQGEISHSQHTSTSLTTAADSDDLEPPSSPSADVLPALSHSPHFDSATGWYHGSVDGLTELLRDGGMGATKLSPGSPPEVVGDAGLEADLGLDEGKLRGYLERYERREWVGG